MSVGERAPAGRRAAASDAPGVEDLAERRAVRRDLDLGPVAGAEQEAGVDLGDLDDLLAAGRPRGGRSRRSPRRSAPWPAGQPDQLLPGVVPGGVGQIRQAGKCRLRFLK